MPAADQGWAAQRERGSFLLLRVMLWITLRLSGVLGGLLLHPITACFIATSPLARAASREFLGRALGRPASRLDVYCHILTFARVTLDRVFLLSDQAGRFRVDVSGLDHLAAVVAEGRGCVLLGAHLGSFEVLRAVGQGCPVPVRPMMYRRNAGALARLLQQLNPGVDAAVIDLGSPAAMLRAQEAVARGEIVGLLADRAPAGQRAVSVPFMGGSAAFPAGPVILAGVLGAPTLLFFGVRTGHRHYSVSFAPFADPVRLGRATRGADVRAAVGRYAVRVEAHARTHPLNWFNFYPFWEAPPDAASRATTPAVLAAARGTDLDHAARSRAAAADPTRGGGGAG